jgi:ABC-type polysaccharide/polyol phosphate export permease
VASSVLAVILVVARIEVGITFLWIPVLLGIMILLAVGIGLLVSAGSLFFRDVKYIVEVFLMFGIFFTPVFYSTATFGERAPLLLLNPVAPILESFSSVIHHQPPHLAWMGYSFAVASLTAFAAYALFKKVESAFAESI